MYKKEEILTTYSRTLQPNIFLQDSLNKFNIFAIFSASVFLLRYIIFLIVRCETMRYLRLCVIRLNKKCSYEKEVRERLFLNN